ncbi:MAG: adenylate/guanylate cyclase domain-containing protein [Spirochaetales bacterium]
MNEILARREQLGVRFSLIFNLGMMVFFVYVTFTAAQSTFELLSELAFIGFGVVTMAFFLWQNYRGGWVHFSGWTLTGTYVVIALLLPFIWYQSVGGDVVPRTYFLKVNILPLDFIFLVLCCLPGRPIYPAVFATAAIGGLAVIYTLAFTDPRLVLTDSILSSTQGPGASLVLTLINTTMFIASGILLTVLLTRFRQTVLEASRAEHSTAQLGRYFSPGVASHIARSDAAFLRPGGQLQNVTVLFSDLRGFTALSEGLEPARVVELLSLYQEQMVAAIFEHGGTLDKFIGDGIMATFGTPHPAPDDASRALQAALAMQTRLRGLNNTLSGRGFPPLRQGIGIHSGPVIAGNVGTASRLEYTVIGDTVNTASRLEALCKQTGDEVLVSEQLVAALGDPRWTFEPRGSLEVRGKAKPLAVFTPS